MSNPLTLKESPGAEWCQLVIRYPGGIAVFSPLGPGAYDEPRPEDRDATRLAAELCLAALNGEMQPKPQPQEEPCPTNP